ncbi:22700_t:CDS:2 [Rhizophagus irregularis]|nr:22700_t:CDS:2 [Rhizophagus irregularis]
MSTTKDDRQGQPDIDSIKQKEDEEWIDRARKGFSDLVKDVRAKKKEIDEKKAKEADAAETTKSTNPVTPIELHEYETTAAWGKIPKYKRTGTNPFAVESSSDEEDIKEGKKRVIGKQGDRSKAEEEESDEEGWTR